MRNINVQGYWFGRETVYLFRSVTRGACTAQVVELVIVASSEAYSRRSIGIRQDKLIFIRSVQLPIIIEQFPKADNMLSKLRGIVDIR